MLKKKHQKIVVTKMKITVFEETVFVAGKSRMQYQMNSFQVIYVMFYIYE